MKTNARKRQLMTKKQRTASLFHRRIIITLPPWSLLVLVPTIFIGMIGHPMLVTNIVSFVLVSVSLILVIVARRQVRALKHDVHEALNNINAEDDDEDDIEDEYADITEKVTLKKMKVNGTKSARVSEH